MSTTASRSVAAYRDVDRARRYDADMDLLHPNRHKMLEVALEVLPFEASAALNVLDVGIGTGFSALELLRRFPNSRIAGVDSSAEMLEVARARLVDHLDRVRLIEARFEELAATIDASKKFDVVVSQYSLHHLGPAAKRVVLKAIVDCLKPGGWFLNADLVSNRSPQVQAAIRAVRVRGIHSRNQGRDPRFGTPGKIHDFLDDLENTEGDQPLCVEQDLELLDDAGIHNATVFWQEYREVVCGGPRVG